jgi:hypothetical protein
MTARTTRTTRIAVVGAGSLLALGLLTSPAFAADGAQAGATVSTGAATAALSQTLDAVNRACADASHVAGTATSAAGSVLGPDSGISIAAQPAGVGPLNLSVSLPALGNTLSGLGGLPLVGSLVSGAQAAPLNVSCAAAGDGSVGLSAAGVGALVNAIAPGLDLSGVSLPGGLSLSADGSVAGPAPAAPAAAPAGASTGVQATAVSPTVRASASAPPRTANLTAAPASASSGSGSNGILAQTVGSPGALARTGAGVGLLSLLGVGLFGSGRLLAFSRRLIRIG